MILIGRVQQIRSCLFYAVSGGHYERISITIESFDFSEERRIPRLWSCAILS